MIALFIISGFFSEGVRCKRRYSDLLDSRGDGSVYGGKSSARVCRVCGVELGTFRVQIMKITIVTATYNRRELLRRLFESLMAQDYRDIEWIVVDDGGSDNTEEAARN